MLKNIKRAAISAAVISLLTVPTLAFEPIESIFEFGDVTVKTLGDIAFKCEPVCEDDESFDFALTLGKDWVLRGIEVLDGENNLIDFNITGVYSYSFELPESGAVILVRSEDHGAASRAETVSALWKLAESPIVDFELSYSDVDEKSEYADAIRWAESEGLITLGESFRPNDQITREELAVVVYRRAMALGIGSEGEQCVLPDSVDRDSIAEWALEAVCWNIENGVMDETSGASGYFMPQSSLTRSELGKAVDMLIKLAESKTEQGESSEVETVEKPADPKKRPSMAPIKVDGLPIKKLG